MKELDTKNAKDFLKENYTSSYRDLVQIAIYYITEIENRSTALLPQIKFLTDLTGIRLEIETIERYLKELEEKGLLYNFEDGYKLTVRGESKLRIVMPDEKKNMIDKTTLKYYINKLSGTVFYEFTVDDLDYYKTYTSKKKRDMELLQGTQIKDSICITEFSSPLILELLNWSDSNVKINTARIAWYQVLDEHYSEQVIAIILDKIETIIETDKDKIVRAMVAFRFMQTLSLDKEKVMQLIKNALEGNTNQYWMYEFAILLVKLEQSFDKTGGRYLKAYQDQFEITEKERIEKLREYFDKQKPVQKEVKNLETAKESTKTVFISYTGNFRGWIDKLGSKLKENGIIPHIDFWDIKFGVRFTDFMNKIEDADYTFMIFTEKYIEKMKSEFGGVSYEKKIIESLISSGSDERIIPIIKESSTKEKIPKLFSSKKYCDLSTKTKFDKNITELIEQIKNQ